MLRPDLDPRSVLRDAQERTALDFQDTAIAWRRGVDRVPDRELPPDEARRWQEALWQLTGPTQRMLAVRRVSPVPVEGLDWGALRADLQGMVAHPDPRLSEVLLRLTLPSPPVGTEARARPSCLSPLLSEPTATGRLGWDALGPHEAAYRTAAESFHLLAWVRIRHDVLAEWTDGRLFTPLQQALLEHWWTWALQTPSAGLAGATADTAPSMHPVVGRLLDRLGEVMSAPVRAAHPESWERPRPPGPVLLAALGVVAKRVATHLGRPARTLDAQSVAARLLTAAQARWGARGVERLQMVALEAGVELLFASVPIEPQGRLLAEGLLAPIEQGDAATRAAWVARGVTLAQAQLAEFREESRRPLATRWTQPLDPQGMVRSDAERVWRDVPDSPLLWRVAAQVGELDPTTTVLPAADTPETWAWARWGTPDEVATQLAGAGVALSQRGANAGVVEDAVARLQQLTPAQLARCTRAHWRPWLRSPFRAVRTWAIRALGTLDTSPAVEPPPPPDGRSSRGR